MRLEDRESNQARSKPDTVNQPLRTARIFVHHYNSTQYCSTESVFIYIHSPSSRPTSHLRCGQLEVRGSRKEQGMLSVHIKYIDAVYPLYPELSKLVRACRILQVAKVGMFF